MPVKTEAKGFLAFLLIDSRGAERQQKQISNNKGNRGEGGGKPHTQPQAQTPTNKQNPQTNQPKKNNQKTNPNPSYATALHLFWVLQQD